MKRINNKVLLIDGKNIQLRKITLEDANENYLQWMQDEQVNQFLESRFQVWSIKKIGNYIKKINESQDSIFLAIIAKKTGEHIGNIKIGPISQVHKFAELGIIIGAKKYWGKGLATETIKKVADYCFESLGLHKVTAGAYIDNIGSIKAFKKNGFKLEGIRKKHFLYKNRYIDAVLLGKVKS